MCVVPTRMLFGPWWIRSAHSTTADHSAAPSAQRRNLSFWWSVASCPFLPPRGLLRSSDHTQCRVGYCADHCTSARCTRNRRPSVRRPPHQQTPTPLHPTTRIRASRVGAVHSPQPSGRRSTRPERLRPPSSWCTCSASGKPPLATAADVVDLSLCISSAPQVPAIYTVDLAGVRSTTVCRETAGVRRCGRARREPLSPSTSVASTPLDGLCPN